jgi:hypothetical protein
MNFEDAPSSRRRLHRRRRATERAARGRPFRLFALGEPGAGADPKIDVWRGPSLARGTAAETVKSSPWPGIRKVRSTPTPPETTTANAGQKMFANSGHTSGARA